MPVGGTSRIPLASMALCALMGAEGCSSTASDPSLSEATSRSSEAIVGGRTASDHPEAAILDLYAAGELFAACSGTVIAPRVLLTAGHCVDGADGWRVRAPYAHNQVSTASAGKTFDWNEGGAETVNPNHHDVGVVFLDQEIHLSAYPQIAHVPVSDGTRVINLGRINNGILSNSQLFASAPIKVYDGGSEGFPLDYAADEVIESGDSGGADYINGTTTIVAVNSGAGGGEVLARVDLVYDWIEQQIASHGGGGYDPSQPSIAMSTNGESEGFAPSDDPAGQGNDSASPTSARTGGSGANAGGGSGGCAVGRVGARGGAADAAGLALVGLVLLGARRRRRG
jgi:MYXO-CTERM domain-containing protein